MVRVLAVAYSRPTAMNTLDGIAQDLRCAFRGLRRHSGFAVIVIATLAVSIGINAAVFTVMKAVLFDGFPSVENADRIVFVTTTKDAVYYPDFETWRSQARSFEDMGLTRGVFKTVDSDGGAPQTYFSTEVTVNTFGLLGVRPILGRDFLAADQGLGSEPVVILSYDLWSGRFGADRSIVGRSVKLSGVPTTVIGVMPNGFSFPEEQSLWTPLSPTAAALNRETFYARYAFGRLAVGATMEQARIELATIGLRLSEEYPRTNEDLTPVVRRFDEWLVGTNGTALYLLLWGAVSLVLLIGCANVANLLLGRAMSQSRDAAIRTALGAGRGRIIRQLATECLVLSAAGGVVGWWIALAALRTYDFAQADDLGVGRVLRFTMDVHVFAYVLVVTVCVGLMVGVAAATRLAHLDTNVAIRGRGALADSRSSRRASSLLVGIQMTLAVMLLANAGVMIHSFFNVLTASVGVDPDNVLSASLYVPPDTYPDVEAQIRFYESLEAKLQALPGVQASGLGVVPPTERVGRSPYELVDAQIGAESSRPTAAKMAVSTGYFRTLGATVLSGRDFNDFDSSTSLPVAVVNDRFARQNWPEQSAIGKQLRVFRNGVPQAWLTVVGVVTDIMQEATRQTFEPLVYVPYRQEPSRNMFAFARVRGDPRQLMLAVSREVYSIDANLPVPALMPLSDRLKRANAFDRNMATLLFAFGAIALLLSSVGLYAAVARTVIARTHEIGLRIAIGASRIDIWKFVFQTAQWPLTSGLCMGLIGAFAVNRLLQAALVGVSAADPFAFAAASAVLLTAAVVGCGIPARRAMRLDPIAALKQE